MGHGMGPWHGAMAWVEARLGLGLGLGLESIVLSG